MVKILTRDFGETEINEEQIYTFPNGLFAFEDARHFALLSPLGEGVYPMWLQSTDGVTPCFIVFDPSLIDTGYEYFLTRTEQKILRIGESSDISLLVIATVPENFRMTTVNMKSPIVLNKEHRIATQVILPLNYQFKLPIYAAQNARSLQGSQVSAKDTGNTAEGGE